MDIIPIIGIIGILATIVLSMIEKMYRKYSDRKIHRDFFNVYNELINRRNVAKNLKYLRDNRMKLHQHGLGIRADSLLKKYSNKRVKVTVSKKASIEKEISFSE